MSYFKIYLVSNLQLRADLLMIWIRMRKIWRKKTKVLLKHSHNILSVWCFKTLSSAFTWIYNVYEKLFKSINSLITQTWTNFIVGNLFHKNSIIWKTKKYQDHNKNLTKQALWNHFKIVANRRFCTIYHSLKIFTTRNNHTLGDNVR